MFEQNPQVSVITVNYNGYTDTCLLIESLLRIKSVSLEIIVVDNASKSDDAKKISNRYPDVRVIASSKNLGFAGGNNLGIREARGEYLFLINNDTEIHEDNLSTLVNRLKSMPEIGILCPKLKFFGTNTIQYAGFTPMSAITLRNKGIGYGEEDNGQYDTPVQTYFAHGAAMLVPKFIIEKVGLMYEGYFLYYEEMDWCARIIRNGYQVWYDPSLTVYHKESQSTGQDSPLKTYYLTRNRIVYARRNLPFVLAFMSCVYQIFLAAPIHLLQKARKGKIKHIRSILNGVYDSFKI